MKRRSKYNNKITYVDNIRFDSGAEADRYCELKLLIKAKVIESLELHPRYQIHLNGIFICTYIADFAYRDLKAGVTITEDVKGKEPDVFKIKRKLFEATFGRKITIVRAA